jgi:NlpC/P60 family
MTTTSKATHHNAPTASRFVQIFVNHKSDPYAYGGTSLTLGADCSGIIYRILTDLGFKNVPRTAAAQADWLKQTGNYLPGNNFVTGKVDSGNGIDLSQGMLIFFHIPLKAGGDGQPGINHVAVYEGNGNIIQESGPNGAPATIVKLSSVKQYAVGAGYIPGLNYNSYSTANNPAQATAGQPKNKTDWAIAILDKLGILPTQNSISVLQAQIQLENTNASYNNPLGLKQNGKLVAYANWQSGLNQTAKTIQANPAMVNALQKVNEYPTTLAQSGHIYANALEHSNWEGYARAPNIAYAKTVLKLFEGGITLKPSKAYQNQLNSNAGQANPESDLPSIPGVSGIVGALEDIAKVFAFFTSAKFWYTLLGGLMIIVGIYLLFHTQVNNEVKKGAKVAAVAA